MPLNLPLAEQALHKLLSDPGASFAGVTDVNRVEAAGDLAAMAIPVFIGSRPQGSDKAKAITIEKSAGIAWGATNVPMPGAQPIFDVSVWFKHDANRSHITPALQVGHLIRILLVGYQGIVEGVTISDIGMEGDGFQRDLPSVDKSDNWTGAWVFPFLVTHEQATASALGVG